MKKLLTAVTLLIIFANSAYALGVTAGTNITNSATINYSVNGVAQPSVTSNEDTFKVDKKIDMVLTTDDTQQVSATPGETDKVTTYTFKNEGNSAENFKFEVKNLQNNEEADYNDKKDNNDVKNLRIEYSTDGGNNWQAIPDNGIINVKADDQVKFRVLADMKTAQEGAKDGDVMNVELQSTAYKDDNSSAEEETSGADTQNQVDVVFADGVDNSTLGDGSSKDGKGDTPRDGKEVARSGYIINTTLLSATKTSCVISDPVNGTNNPKRIPGAVIRYMFDIKNSGSIDISDLNITDTLDSNLDLTNTASSAKKSENQDDACVCSNEPSTDISGDTTINGQKLKIIHINIQSGKHTCVSVETEIK